MQTTKSPISFSRSPSETVRRPPPELGADTREVLAEAGLSEPEIDALLAN